MRGRFARNGLTASLVALALAAGACNDQPAGDVSGPDLTTGKSLVSVLLTDAPGDIAEAWVQVDAIYLQGHSDVGDDNGDNGDDDNGDDGDNGDDSGNSDRFFLLDESTDWINLTDLAGQTLVIVEGIPIPAGFFSELRFVVGDAAIVTGDGMVYVTPGADLEALNAARSALDPEAEPIEAADGTLQCPSCSQSGLKVNLPDGEVEIAEGNQIIVLDFDASESFGHVAGKSGRWIMHPVITATDFESGEGEEEEPLGNIAGTVALDTDVTLPACGGGDLDLSVFVPIARMGDTEVMTSVAAEDGTYAFDPMAVGDWEMDFVTPIDFDNGDQLVLEATADPATATVEADATTTVDYTITSATCNTGG